MTTITISSMTEYENTKKAEILTKFKNIVRSSLLTEVLSFRKEITPSRKRFLENIVTVIDFAEIGIHMKCLDIKFHIPVQYFFNGHIL